MRFTIIAIFVGFYLSLNFRTLVRIVSRSTSVKELASWLFASLAIALYAVFILFPIWCLWKDVEFDGVCS